MRGSIRRVMVTDSEPSLLPATADSMRQTSNLFSAQKSASATSLSKNGTSSHLIMAHVMSTYISLMGQSLIHLPLVEESFFGFEQPGVDNPDHFAVRAIHAEDASAADNHAEVKK